MLTQIEAIDYTAGAPDSYQCQECGARGVKLWRDYQTFLDHQRLLCLECACKDQDLERTPTEDGQSLYTGKVFHFYSTIDDEPGCGRIFDPKYGVPENAMRAWIHRERHASIGWMVPAVPTEDGETFWGYTSVPQAGCEWWHRLPATPSGRKLVEDVRRMERE